MIIRSSARTHGITDDDSSWDSIFKPGWFRRQGSRKRYRPEVPLSDLTRPSVSAALDEFDRLGRELFLDKYGFGKARSYFVVRNGKYYDSKAIAGAAHGFLEGRTALLASTFSGGAATVAAQLKSLGFVVSSERSPD